MPYLVTLPNGETARTDEMLVERVIDVAKAHKTSWAHVVDMPIVGDGALMLDLYKRLCAEHGCQPPVVLTATKLASFYTNVAALPEPGTGDGDDQDSAEATDVDPQTVDAPAST